MEQKTCNTCMKLKSIADFSKQSSSRDGRKYRCKDCDKRYFDHYYNRKRPEVLNKVRDWQKKNPMRVMSYKDKYKDKKLGLFEEPVQSVEFKPAASGE